MVHTILPRPLSPPSAAHPTSAPPSSPPAGPSPAATSAQIDARDAHARHNPPPSPSSDSQSDGAEGPDGEGYGDLSPSYKLDPSGVRRGAGELPKPKSLLPRCPSTSLSGRGWRQPRANTDILSPANLPHEILLHIFKFLLTRTTGHSYLRSCLLVCRSWCLCGVELLWHRPAFFHLSSLVKLIQTIRSPEQTFPYVTFIRRLNFSGIATELTDQLFGFMSKCSRLERLAIAECSELSDQALTSTLASLNNLVSIDLTNVKNLTDDTLQVMAQSCKRLQGVNFTNCRKITSRGVAALGDKCPLLRRVKFCSCEQLGDEGVLPLIIGCPMLLEVDFYNCPLITDKAVRQMWISSSHVRELRLANCGPLTDAGFPAPVRMLTSSAAALDLSPSTSTRLVTASSDHLNSVIGHHGSESAPTSRGASPVGSVRDAAHMQSRSMASSQPAYGHNRTPSALARGYAGSVLLSTPLKPPKTFEHLRILDLTNCNTISDDAIEGIISNAPRVRNLGLSKCTRLTDEAIYSISKLGKNLQYLHLGHVSNITDRGMRHLVDHCTRIRYLDLANCTQLTDLSVMELAAKLPKLKRIGLVRVHHITDNALYALVERHLNLQRVHLSYCNKISVAAVFWLLERLPKVTHISLTGVTAFQRPELQAMCRPPPDEFSPTQRESFCVYSGHGVVDLHQFLRNIYSSEASARQFSNQNAELSAEDYRAIHLMREKAERSRHDRRWRYQRQDPAKSLQAVNESDGSLAFARWPVDHRRTGPSHQSTILQQHYQPHLGSSATPDVRFDGSGSSPSLTSRFPLSHITTSSILRRPRQFDAHFDDDGFVESSAMDEEQNEEDPSLAAEAWRSDLTVNVGQGWPSGVSSPDFAQMDPRAWSMPSSSTAEAEQERSMGSRAAPPLSQRHTATAFQGPTARNPLEQMNENGLTAASLSSNATRPAAEGWHSGEDALYSARTNSGPLFDLPMSTSSYTNASPNPQQSPNLPNNLLFSPSVAGQSVNSDHRWAGSVAQAPPPSFTPESYYAHSSSPVGALLEEPVHSRGGGTGIGSSSRSSSSSAQPYGIPMSDSSVSTLFPPAATMNRSTAHSGASTAGNGAAREGAPSSATMRNGSGPADRRDSSHVRSMFMEQRRAMASMSRERGLVAQDVRQRQQAQQASLGAFETRNSSCLGSGQVDLPTRNDSPMRLDETPLASQPSGIILDEDAAGEEGEEEEESDDKFLDTLGDAPMSSSSSSLSNAAKGTRFVVEEGVDGAALARLAHVREQRLRMLGERS